MIQWSDTRRKARSALGRLSGALQTALLRGTVRLVAPVRPIVKHTSSIEDPRTVVPVHVRLFQWGLRASQITGLDTTLSPPERRSYWSAAGWLTRLHWLPGFEKLDKQLREGASAGVTFDSGEFVNQQNRLMLVRPPWWLVPPGKRRREKAGPRDLYRWEVYDIGAASVVGKEEGGWYARYGRYAQIGELAPEAIPRTPRVRLGSWAVWWLAGRYKDYVRLLVTDDRPEPTDHRLLCVARCVGVLVACMLTPVLYPLAAFVRRKSS